MHLGQLQPRSNEIKMMATAFLACHACMTGKFYKCLSMSKKYMLKIADIVNTNKIDRF